MVRVRPLPYRIVIKKLRKSGFVFRRSTGGTHEVWWSETAKKTCIVPHHKEIKLGTLKSILRQAGLTADEFIKK